MSLWCDVVRRGSDERHDGHGFDSRSGRGCVTTLSKCLSSSSRVWYRPKGDVALGWKVMAAFASPCLWFYSPAGGLLRTGISSGTDYALLCPLMNELNEWIRKQIRCAVGLLYGQYAASDVLCNNCIRRSCEAQATSNICVYPLVWLQLTTQPSPPAQWQSNIILFCVGLAYLARFHCTSPRLTF